MRPRSGRVTVGRAGDTGRGKARDQGHSTARADEGLGERRRSVTGWSTGSALVSGPAEHRGLGVATGVLPVLGVAAAGA
ncbi:hypothetical protein [Streptomyces sp. NPDC093261]|uniref:hypothetical protein n=1 Tax=Streptomyces sp. NPDC093261 TaxID=3366037 RepID=UPI003818265F